MRLIQGYISVRTATQNWHILLILDMILGCAAVE
jgi:hypothetical protein